MRGRSGVSDWFFSDAGQAVNLDNVVRVDWVPASVEGDLGALLFTQNYEFATLAISHEAAVRLRQWFKARLDYTAAWAGDPPQEAQGGPGEGQ